MKPRIQCHAQSGRSYNTLVIPTVAKRSGGICFYAAVPRELLAPRSMLLNFIHREAFTVQAMHLDCRTVLGPRVNVASLETLLRLLTYLGRDARADRRIRER